MKQFLLPLPPDREGKIFLDGKDYHYLVRVRRLKKGDSFPAVLPGGATAMVRVEADNGSVLTGVYLESASQEPAAGETMATEPPRIILFQSIPHGAKMDTIVRQAAEGALSEVVPFFSAFSPPRSGPNKTGRWRRIIREARQQSGSPVATELREPCSLDEALSCWGSLKGSKTVGLLFHHIPLAQETLHSYLSIYPGTVVIAIGPEGGFSPDEAERFINAGFRPVTLGNTVFRVETAALYCAAAVRVILLENSSWTLKQMPE
ncbi:MAG: 16S rRNA (uracil(1498)-N(3))-methyltransferase [Spirochaetaceae bacterium]|nr:16S rRNA (uracil(1498)-N(3))-methyltransferase [Spirochaetaceae bacterium]